MKTIWKRYGNDIKTIWKRYENAKNAGMRVSEAFVKDFVNDLFKFHLALKRIREDTNT